MLPFRRRSRGYRAVGREVETNNLAESLITILEPGSVAAEAYHGLRTNLLYSPDNLPKTVVLTSPSPKEGKSTICANLSVALAQVGSKRILTVDCDLRRPALHKLFELQNSSGIADVLMGVRSLQEVWMEPYPGLKVACAGPLPPYPTELLSSERLSNFLASVREEFDFVLIDTPPLEVVADAAILAPQVDGVMLVVDAQHTGKKSVRKAVRSLRVVRANILGTVMNKAKPEKGDFYYYN